MSPFGISCGTCKNFDSSMPDLPEGDGACRAHAPVTQLLMVPSQHKITGQQMLSPQQFSLYPRVSGEKDYCGEHQRPLMQLGGKANQ